MAVLQLTGCAPSVDYSKIKSDPCGEVSSATGQNWDAGVVLISAPNASFTDMAHIAPSIESTIEKSLGSKTFIGSVLAAGSPLLGVSTGLDRSKDVFGANARQNLNLAVGSIVASQKCSEGPGNGQPAELDLLSAIESGARILKAHAPDGEKTIYVFSNGLQTTGDLDLRDALAGTPEDIATKLMQRGAIPDLKGVSVDLFGLGQTTGDYPRLPTSSRTKLAAIWQEILERGGATFFDGGPIATGKSNTQGAFVSPVAPLISKPIVQGCRTILTDENIAFLPDSAEFADSRQALLTAKTVLQFAGKSGCGSHLMVTGFTTNFGKVARQLELSKLRATAVSKLLLSLDANLKISIKGLGYDGSGELDPSNRRVEVLISAN